MEQISNIDILIIRQCKTNKLSINNLKKLVCRRHALSYSYVTNSDLIYVLTNIVLDYKLIRDMYEFIAVDLNPNNWRNKIMKVELSYEDNLIEELISKIRCAPVVKFPRYITPLSHRNK